MLDFLCECVAQLSATAGQVLEANAAHALCTGTQCFASEADAFGVQARPAATVDVFPTFMIFLLAAATAMRATRPASLPTKA